MSVLPVGFSGSGDYTIEESLRFNASQSSYLNRTPSASNRKTWTWSGWVKRANPAGNGVLFAARTGGGATYLTLVFSSLGDLRMESNSETAYPLYKTNALFRDPSAWYHIVVALDMTQATSTDRLKVWVNGVLQTTASYNVPAQNTDLAVNSTETHLIGQQASGSYFDGYQTEVNFIDGQALTPSSFGEFDNTTGVWKPKKYTGTYGTNGFFLDFSDATSATTLGYDYSGNSNNWTLNSFDTTSTSAAYCSMTDTPTPYFGGGNYAVMNPLDKLDGSLANGNLSVTTGTVGGSNCRATIPMQSGKWYFEMTPTSNGGIAELGISIYPGSDVKQGTVYTYYADTGEKFSTSGGAASYGSTYTTGDVIGIAYDATNGKIWWAKNNVWQASGDPANGTNAAYTGISGDAYAYVTDRNVGGVCVVQATFGQRPFAYTPPAGFLPLHTGNLPDSTIVDGSQYFDAVTYSGTGVEGRTISVGFQPDFIWTKSRSSAYDNVLIDANRGITQVLRSNLTGEEYTDVTTVQSITSSGYTVGLNNFFNQSGQTYVSWNWKASNAAGVSNTAGTITSTVSANTTSGFSIVSYTGTGANATVGHGLGVAPKMVIVKNRDAVVDWPVWHTALLGTEYLLLDLTDAKSAIPTTVWNSTAPTSTVFSLGANATSNGNTQKHVAYCFADVPGFSKFGSYTGNGSADGPFVYLGFRPKWVMYKRTDTSGSSWVIIDTSRDTYNYADKELYPNLSNSENTGSARIDILSNGYKIRSDSTYGYINASGGTYIYAAFAENPAKYALAR